MIEVPPNGLPQLLNVDSISVILLRFYVSFSVSLLYRKEKQWEREKYERHKNEMEREDAYFVIQWFNIQIKE